VATATSLACGVGVTAFMEWSVMSLSWPLSSESLFVMAFAIFGFGFLPGIAQWFVLRQHFSHIFWRILATVGGFMLFLLLVYFSYRLLYNAAESDVGSLVLLFLIIFLIPMNIVVYGLITGFLQWFDLRSRISNSTMWIKASVLGWSVGLGFGSVFGSIRALVTFIVIALSQLFAGFFTYTDSSFTVALVFALIGLLIGLFSAMITGSTMEKLLPSYTPVLDEK
jgi:hypothetical protein